MVAAQIMVAQKQGCVVKRDIVLDITKSEDNWYILHTESGTVLKARKVLLATNVFTSMNNLLGNVHLEFTPMPQTVTLAEVSAHDAYKLRSIPVVLYKGLGDSTWSSTYPRNPDGSISFYMLPPIQYPDGKYYIKLGHSDHVVKPLEKSQIRDWYCGKGDKDLELHMFNLLKGIFPDLKFLSHHGDACVTMVTPTYHPYIDLLSPTFGLAVGGNGWAAKSSDEIGRVAADMIVHSKWTYDIPWENFKVRVRNSRKTTSKL
ncbi:hypothetical protein FSP39_007257 [Pinctada imbricata]|uniref:FAD dependent oxidoreductase domain-containing protein n=1 Tax=Pinctada imbricata TaxID=66713 RepID=A0AA88YC22_PINIB|nr:hypothetical protein FSP39_007257 [Pinctada imbricata]